MKAALVHAATLASALAMLLALAGCRVVPPAAPVAPHAAGSGAPAAGPGPGVAALAAVLEDVHRSELALDSLHILARGQLALHRHPFQPEWRHDLASITKTVTAFVAGVAALAGKRLVLSANPLAIRALTVTLGEATLRMRFEAERESLAVELGLDGVPRVALAQDGSRVAGVGRWRDDGLTAEVRRYGHAQRIEFHLDPQPGGARLRFREHTGLFDFEVQAR